MPFASSWFHPRFLVGSSCSSFVSVLCCVFVLFVFVLCLVYRMLLVSLNDPLKFINDFYKAKPV